MHRLAGDLGSPKQPITFGHEGVGTIEELGARFVTDSSGTPLAAGDTIYWSTMSNCHRCHACVVLDEPILCDSYPWPVPLGQPSPAAYQELATLTTSTACARVPEGIAPEAVIAFGCAMPTALGAFRRLGGIDAGDTVLIQGCGPVGLALTVLASLTLAERIVVLGGPSARLKVALDLGATDVVELDGGTPEERRESILALTAGRGADVILEAAGRPDAFAEGLRMLAPAGRYVIVGLYSGRAEVPVDPVVLNNANQRVIGSLGYRPEDIRHTVSIAARIGTQRGFDRLVGSRFALPRTEDGIRAAAMAGHVKCVVAP
ncbi:hypothetical protein CcI49_29025 [Frankia sp. CcI49]|nr:hypothetical protein CcI49_29025 [Frankia sp. CcI49]